MGHDGKEVRGLKTYDFWMTSFVNSANAIQDFTVSCLDNIANISTKVHDLN